MREVSREGRGRLRRAGRAGAVAAALGLAAWAQAFGAAGPKDEALYGEARPEPHVRHVAAGPIRMKFQDGELRYLRVGQREIVRRIYFAVRDERWDTVMPRFTRLQVDAKADAPPVEALAVRADGGGAVVWLSNSTDRAQAVVLEGLGRAAKAALWRLGADGPAASSVPVEGGRLALELGAFEVCRITAAGPD
jgi:hypothetical protein